MTAIIDEPDFGQYDLLAKIGEGPRGPLFVARDTGAKPSADRGPHYLVELSAFATGEDEAQRAFVHDVEHAARIQHHNVLGIVEIGATTAGRFVATPYVEGATLGDLQERHRAIRPPRLVLAAVIDALHGLHAAHSFRSDGVPQPLVHGSLSPDHLWVGLDGTCRVTGFGHARPRVETKPSRRCAANGYLAPEQLNGEPIDPRTDLFSLGVVLWNALTGKKLFHDRIEHQTMSNVLERKVPRPSSIGLSPPPVLDALVMKALERDPARRFQGAAEMAGALRDVARGAACLATGAEVAEWIAATFGADLTVRRSAIRELSARSSRGEAAVVLPRLVAPVAGDATARDYLSLEELGRANESPPRRPATTTPGVSSSTRPGRTSSAVSTTASASASATALTTASGEVAPLSSPEAPAHRHLAIVAAAAFAVVACVLGWRWSVATAAAETAELLDPAPAPPPPPRQLHVTVLDVREVAPSPSPTPTTAKPVAPTSPSPGKKPIPAATGPAPVASPPSRAPSPRPKRVQRPAPVARPADLHADPAEPKPSEPRLDPTPSKPEPSPRPTLESNPYIYNK